jgi:cytochrome c oxidase subunit IV
MASARLYVGIWLALVLATILEVVTRTLPGSTQVLVFFIVLIASVKAIIIALYYQHLRYEGIRVAAMPLAAIVALAALAITMIVSMGM